MTPAPPTRPGRPAVARPLTLLAACAITLGACIGGGVSDPTPPSPSVASASPPSSAASSPTLQPSPSSSPVPSETAEPSPLETPTDAPSLDPAAAVEACTGSDDNRAFYLAAAEDLAWPVYCPVLPARWFVEVGRRSGRGIGQVDISYKGPAGATLALRQGGFCETSDGCVPAGTDVGEAMFGDQPGTLITLDDGGYAIVVGRAETVSWLVVATGMDEPTFRDLAASFVRLD